MLLDIVGYILMGLFSILGIVAIFFGAVTAIGVSVAFVGAVFEDLKSLSNLFKK